MLMKKIMLVLFIASFYAVNSTSQTLHIYGGEDHDVYLGCLTCNDYDKNSIWNSYSQYGNNYNPNSIWNSYGTYGNDFSTYSPWNTSGQYPPVIVDKNGEFYGYLTANKYNNKRAEFQLVLTMYKYYDLISKNVDQWYKKLFE